MTAAKTKRDWNTKPPYCPKDWTEFKEDGGEQVTQDLITGRDLEEEDGVCEMAPTKIINIIQEFEKEHFNCEMVMERSSLFLRGLRIKTEEELAREKKKKEAESAKEEENQYKTYLNLHKHYKALGKAAS